MMPENGASMADAARTRENEGGCICDPCGLNVETCGLDPNFCEKAASEQHGDDQREARRDGA